MRVQSPRVQLILFGSVLALVVGPITFGQFSWMKSEAATTKGTTLAQSKPVAKTDAGDAKQNALIAEGKKRFQAYKCYDCHGQNGEGTDDAPSLTHSKLTGEQVSKFLVKPSTDAQNKGMPDIPVDSPDHKPLVAYVMSLRAK